MAESDFEGINWFSQAAEKQLPLDKEERDQLLFNALRRARGALANFPAVDGEGQPIEDEGRTINVFEAPGQKVTREAQQAAFHVAVAYGAAIAFQAFEGNDTHGFSADMARAAAEEFKRETQAVQEEMEQLKGIFAAHVQRLRDKKSFFSREPHPSNVLSSLEDDERIKLEQRMTQFFWRVVRLYAALTAISCAYDNLYKDSWHAVRAEDTSAELRQEAQVSFDAHPLRESFMAIKELWRRLITSDNGAGVQSASEYYIPFRQWVRQYDVRWVENSLFGFYPPMGIEGFPLASFRDFNADVGF